MTEDFKNDFNIKCAKFLEFKTNSKKMHWKYTLDDNSYFTKSINDLHSGYIKSYMRFHSDWNWIMEVLKKITKVGWNWELIDFNGTIKEGKTFNCSIFNLELNKPLNKITFVSNDNKEAVIYTINEFLSTNYRLL